MFPRKPPPDLIRGGYRFADKTMRQSRISRACSDSEGTEHALAAFVNIFLPDDVVFPEIAAGLHLDQFERDLAGVGEAVNRADRDIGRLVLMNDFLDVADRH